MRLDIERDSRTGATRVEVLPAWPPGMQLALAVVAVVCGAWLVTIALRCLRVVLRGYPPRR